MYPKLYGVKFHMLLERNGDIMLVLSGIKNIDRPMDSFCVLDYSPRFLGQDTLKFMTLPGAQKNNGVASLWVNLSC